MVKHTLETPNGMTLIGAATLPQLEQTAQKQYMDMLPERFIKDRNKQKNYIDLMNGHRVLFRPLDDEGKARSLNLSAWWIEEASEVDYEYFVQLQTRLRNKATKRHMGIMTTNPDLNWIREEFLLKSTIVANSNHSYQQFKDDINPSFVTHIAPTYLNKYLPDDYYEVTKAGKPDWWVRRYLEGSFTAAEGLVYPNYMDHIVDPFDIPEHWERLMALDPGIHDPTAVLWSAIDPISGTVYVYDEHYETDKPVSYHAEKINERNMVMRPGVLRQPIGDPKGKARSDVDLRSLFDHYAEYGIYLKPGMNRIEDGVSKVYNYFELGRLKIFSNLENTLREFREYKYPEQKLGQAKNAGDKPRDYMNHSMDVLRYQIMELPDNPDMLRTTSFGLFKGEANKRLETHLPHALQDDEVAVAAANDWYGY